MEIKKRVKSTFTNKKSSNYDLLEGVQEHVKKIMTQDRIRNDVLHPAFIYLRAITNMINFQQHQKAIVGYDSPDYDDICKGLTAGIDQYSEEIRIINLQKEDYFKFKLRNSPIITPIWNFNRISTNIACIGENYMRMDGKPNSFMENESNHRIMYLYPLGIAVMMNGNHSVYSGLLKGEGEVTITQMIDLTPLVLNCSFHHKKGVYSNGYTPVYFELGMLFELGKIFQQNKQIFPFHVKKYIKQ